MSRIDLRIKRSPCGSYSIEISAIAVWLPLLVIAVVRHPELAPFLVKLMGK